MKKTVTLFSAAVMISTAAAQVALQGIPVQGELVEATATEPELPEEFTDGFFIQNEDWFGHYLSSINWVGSDGTVYYNVDDKVNGTEVLGNTSQFGQIYGDYYYVTSKQAPRFIILDAKTLKVQKSFDTTGVGDGRDVLNVDDDKLYVGGANGIIVYDKNEGDFKNQVEGTSGGQVGMMVRVGNYVFAAEQSTGVLVIDPVTDAVVQTIERTSAQGLTVTRDGHIWCTLPSESSIMRIDPVTFETKVFEIGKTLVNSWGQCKPGYVCASYTEDALFVVNGASRHDSAKLLSKFTIDENGDLVEDDTFQFTMPTTYTGLSFYGSPRINPNTGDLLATVMTYRGYNHELLYINPANGEVKQEIDLLNDDGNIYYWFPSMPVFPDNAEPEITVESVTMNNDGNPSTLAVADFVSDADNLPVLSVVSATIANTAIASVEYDGLNLIVTPISAGNTSMTIAVNSNGKNVEKTIPVTVIPALPGRFTDGFFIQNEDWFGHRLGSINWVGSDGTFYYNAVDKVNGNAEVLGNTSQFGQIYGGYYYVMSKQAPRLVVLDAETLEVVKSFDEIGGGDGRAVLGVDEGKVYVGSSAGIFTLDVANNFTLSDAAIVGTAGESLYSGQIGMMARVGKYVFATMQSTGVLVIDPSTDAVVTTIENGNASGVIVSRDGTVWVPALSQIMRIDPVTLEYQTIDLPNTMTSIWGAWMPDKMCADPDEDALYYTYGGSFFSGDASLGKLIINDDGTLSDDPEFVFTMPDGAVEGRTQMFYGKIDIDPISGYLIATTTQSGYGTNYSYNWLHYIDRTTGEVVKSTIVTSDSGEGYYWFPAMPVFPDNNAPEVDIDDISASIGDTFSYTVTEFLSDADNLPALAVVEVETSDESIVTVGNDGLTFTVSAVGEGSAYIMLTANSNGRVIEKTISVEVANGTSSADMAADAGISIVMAGEKLRVAAPDAGTVVVFGMDGRQVLSQGFAGSATIDLAGLSNGAYIVKVVSANNLKTQKIVKM